MFARDTHCYFLFLRISRGQQLTTRCYPHVLHKWHQIKSQKLQILFQFKHHLLQHFCPSALKVLRRLNRGFLGETAEIFKILSMQSKRIPCKSWIRMPYRCFIQPGEKTVQNKKDFTNIINCYLNPTTFGYLNYNESAFPFMFQVLNIHTCPLSAACDTVVCTFIIT